MNQYRVVHVEPGKPAVEKKIGTKLEDLQAEVGGLIECIYCHRDGTLIVANDEAKLKKRRKIHEIERNFSE